MSADPTCIQFELSAINKCHDNVRKQETGRTHQIRVHAKHVGNSILGDAEYGAGPWNAAQRERRLALRAKTLGLGRMSCVAPSAAHSYRGTSVYLLRTRLTPDVVTDRTHGPSDKALLLHATLHAGGAGGAAAAALSGGGKLISRDAADTILASGQAQQG